MFNNPNKMFNNPDKHFNNPNKLFNNLNKLFNKQKMFRKMNIFQAAKNHKDQFKCHNLKFYQSLIK